MILRRCFVMLIVFSFVFSISSHPIKPAIAVDSNGWAIAYGSVGSEYLPYSVPLPNGNIAMAGNVTGSSISFVVVDKYGKIIDSTKKIFTLASPIKVTCISARSNGNILIGGDIQVNLNDFFVLELDQNGSIIDKRDSFNNKINPFYIPLTGNDYSHSIQATSDGGVIIVGMSYSFSSTGHYLIIKIKNDNSQEWATHYFMHSLDSSYYVAHTQHTIIETQDNGFAIGAWFYDGSSSDQYTILRFDKYGNLLWSKKLASIAQAWVSSIFQTYDGGFVISGTIAYGSWHVLSIKLDSTGNIIWAKSFGFPGNTDWAVQTIEGSNNSLVTVSNNWSNNHILTYQTDSNGDLSWVNIIAGTGSDIATGISKTALGYLNISGYTSSYGQGSNDFLMVNMDSNGHIYQDSIPGSILQHYDSGFPIETINQISNVFKSDFNPTLLSVAVTPTYVDVSYTPASTSLGTVIAKNPTPPAINKPEAPTNLKAFRIDDNKIRLEWDQAIAGTYPISKYKIYVSDNGTILNQEISIGDPDLYKKTIINSSKGQITIYVTAVDDHGNESDKSNLVIQNALPIIFVHGWQGLDETYDERDFFVNMINTFLLLYGKPTILTPITANDVDSNQAGLFESLAVSNPDFYKSTEKNNDNDEKWNFYRIINQNVTNAPNFYISNYNKHDKRNRKLPTSLTPPVIKPSQTPPPIPNPTKDSILIFSTRLAIEIQKIKQIENVEKVNIIAHSMGGIVSRGYIEFNDFISPSPTTFINDLIKKESEFFFKGNIFPNLTKYWVDNKPPVNQLIMLGTPNHGAMSGAINGWLTDPEFLKEIPFAKAFFTYHSTKDMSPYSRMLNILNYGIDKVEISIGKNNIKKEDSLPKDVEYFTIAGLLPYFKTYSVFGSVMPVNDRTVLEKFNEFSGDKNGFNDFLIKNLINNRDVFNNDFYDDGFIQMDSVYLPGSTFFPYLWCDHTSLIKQPQSAKLVWDIISENITNEIKYDVHWNSITTDNFIGNPAYVNLIARWASPIEPLVSNNQGQRFGYQGGIGYNEIPDTFFSFTSESIVSYLPYTDLVNEQYKTEFLGTDTGKYGIFNDIFFSSDDEIKNHLVFSTTNQPIVPNQLDVYQPNWSSYFANVPYQMIITKDYNGDGIADESFQTPYSPATLNGIVDYNLIHLSWTHSKQGTYPIKGYQIYRSLDNLTFSLIGETTANTFTDLTGFLGKSYYYYVLAVDIKKNPSPPSQVIFLGPVTALPKPELNLSIEMNKNEFQYGEDVLYKVEIINTGNGEAFDTVLILTLPSEVQYIKNDKYFGEVQPNGQVIFHIGTIPRRDKKTFQINGVIAIKAAQERGVSTIFELKAKEADLMRKILNLILKPKKSGNSGSGNINIQFLNLKTDPETGERYIDLSTELEMKLGLDGFTSPCEIVINWGDGVIDPISKTKETTMLFKHKYSSKGTMKITIKVTDAVGRTKEVPLNLRVR